MYMLTSSVRNAEDRFADTFHETRFANSKTDIRQILAVDYLATLKKLGDVKEHSISEWNASITSRDDKVYSWDIVGSTADIPTPSVPREPSVSKILQEYGRKSSRYPGPRRHP